MFNQTNHVVDSLDESFNSLIIAGLSCRRGEKWVVLYVYTCSCMDGALLGCAEDYLEGRALSCHIGRNVNPLQFAVLYIRR